MFGMIRNSLFGPVEVWPCRVLSKGEKDEVAYEERVYEGGQFATVELTGKPFDEALREAVLKLLKYIGGSNDQGAGMGMMAPVCTTVFPGDDGSLQQKVKVLLRIPSQFQASPPLPSDESIQIEERGEMTVYSTQFGGYAKEVDYVNYAAKLSSALGKEVPYQQDFYFCNGYDPPMKPYGRRNEIWLLKMSYFPGDICVSTASFVQIDDCKAYAVCPRAFAEHPKLNIQTELTEQSQPIL